MKAIIPSMMGPIDAEAKTPNEAIADHFQNNAVRTRMNRTPYVPNIQNIDQKEHLVFAHASFSG